MKLFQCVVLGEPASKANSRQQFKSKKTGKMFSAKAEKALNYVDNFMKQVATDERPIECEVVLVCDIYYRTQRPDLDESLIMDCMQKAGIIKNDRQVKTKFIDHFIDKENPRAEIKLFERKKKDGYVSDDEKVFMLIDQ